MNKSDLARRLARKRLISKAQAADQLDGFVHDILDSLRAGESASLPGLGTLKPGRKPRFRSAAAAGSKGRRRRKSTR